MLRELCWQTEKGFDQKERIEPLLWLLRETSLGAEHLPADIAVGPLRQAADKLAKAASSSRWTAQKTRTLFDHLAQLAKALRASPAPQQFGRADLLALAMQGVATGNRTKAEP
jgi:hypothetical protein